MRSPRVTEVALPAGALVGRAIAHDESAITTLYQRHARYIAGVVYRILGSDADLDDIVQETFVEGFRHLDTLRDPESLRSFLVTIAVRRIHARLSLRSRMRTAISELFGMTPAVSDPEASEAVHSLYRQLARMPPKHRVAWALHKIEGYTLPEVADHTGSSLATVKRWIASVDAEVEADHASE